MSSTFFTRALPCLAIMLPLLAGCPADDHSVGNDDNDSGTTGDGGKKSGPDTGTSSGCQDPNPGCCGVNSEGCSAIVAQASCLDGAWTCSKDEAVGPECNDLCVGTVDGGSTGCEGDAPTCCGINSQGCSAIVGNASCSAGGWVCASGEAPGGACTTICAADGSAPLEAGEGSTFTCGDQGLTCDSATQYCYISEGGVATPDGGSNVFPSCKALPSSCQTAPTCACIEAVPGNSIGSCMQTGNAVTLTIANP
jgi:hypothetical protein